MPAASAPHDLRFEHWTPGVPALGIGAAAPRLSWIVPRADPGWSQAAYEVEVCRNEGELDVVTVHSGEQVLVPWPVAPLRSRERVAVRVRVRDDGPWSEWSDPAHVEAGPLDATDWSAAFVSPRRTGALGDPAPVLHGVLHLPGGTVTCGRLYASAHGVYLAHLNGERVGDLELAPGWTSYAHRLRYQTYDVTDLLRPGRNELTVLLGNGWFRSRVGFRDRPTAYGDRLALLAQLEVTTAEGRRLTLATDDSWTVTEGAVLADDLYDGQRTDLRRDRFAASAPDEVEAVPADLRRLVAPDGPPVRATGVLPAVAVHTTPSGRTIVDFGQNLVGRVRLRSRGGAAGGEVVVRHAEVLEDGELGVRPLRTAQATDSWLLAGGDEVLEPQFTFHGFRYAEVSGVDDLQAEDVDAVVLGSDLRRTGWFHSSDPELDRLHENVVWGARGNFLDVPTDCPQRDERLGWTGDIQVFAPTATFLFDVAGFLTSWLADLAADQYPDGTIPFVVPDVLSPGQPATATWGDAAVVVPSVLHARYGDVAVLARQLPSMRAWVDHVTALTGPDGLWRGGFQFGDWLDPTAPPDDPFRGQADADVIATAELARSAALLADAAAVLGEADVATRYRGLAERTRAAFSRAYVTPDGRVHSDAPTAYALALVRGLLPSEDQRATAGQRLADLARARAFRISTGFVGTPLVAEALAETGHLETAYRLLLQRACPSWLYPVTMGATTVWERWDSMLPDGRINPGEMTSFNHYALGAVADWLHRTVAGLAPAAPGFRELLVRPRPGGGLTAASARHRTPYGLASVAWERADGSLAVEVTVPVGCRATVDLPGDAGLRHVGHGSHTFRVADPVPRSSRAIHTVRDVVDDPALWADVVTAAVDTGVARDDTALAGQLARWLDAPAGSLVTAVAGFGSVPGGAAFAERAAALIDDPAAP